MRKNTLNQLMLMFCSFVVLIALKLFTSDSMRVFSNYTKGFYEHVKNTLANISVLFSFSYGELLVGIVLLLGIIILLKRLTDFMKQVRLGHMNSLRLFFIRDSLSALNLLLIVVIIFQLMWGLNYYQPSLNEQLHLEEQLVDSDILFTVLSHLSEKMVLERETLAKTEDDVITTEASVGDLLQQSFENYQLAAVKYDFIEMPASPPKAILSSILFSYNGISGIYNPFTGEANVNVLNSEFMLPVVALHELTHQQGIAREDEANFLAYLIAQESEDSFTRYSGDMLVLIHGLNNLRAMDDKRYNVLYESLSPGIISDLKAHQKLWAKYQGALDRFQDSLNDHYLKINGQETGVESYSDMIELYVAWTLKNI